MEEQKDQKVTEQPAQSKEKKISFISAMLIVMGGSIGAGIFFKSGEVLGYSQGNLILSIFSWLLASGAVIAMSLALIEIASVRDDNLSLMSWNKVFNSDRIYRASKDFMTYIYLPLTYLFMPMYVIMSLQDGIGALQDKDAAVFDAAGGKADWIIWFVIGMAMTLYFMTIPPLFSRVGDIQNIVVLAFKFIPLIFVPIMGIVIAATGNADKSIADLAKNLDSTPGKDAITAGKSILNFKGLGAFLGVFLSISAIFFAYDGFYVAAGIQSEMKEPKKTPAAMFLGMAATTLIYLIIAFAMSINGGSFFGMQDGMEKVFKHKRAAQIVFGIINICIAIGVTGILNGFSMWAPRYVEDLLAFGDLPLWEKYQSKLNANKPKVGIIYSLILIIPIVIIFTIIGALAYLPGEDYTIYSNDEAHSMARLYTFCDLMANWTALFTFTFLGYAIFGGILNRKKNFVEIPDKKKYFIPTAWISVIFVFSALLITMITPIIDMFLLAGIDKAAFGEEAFKEEVIGRTMLVVVLIVFFALTYLPAPIEDAVRKNKYGSLEKYNEYKKSKLLLKGDISYA